MSTAFGTRPLTSDFFRDPGRTAPRRPARKQSRWSEEEMAILREYACLGARVLAKKLPGRTIGTIRTMAVKHKIPIKRVRAAGYKRPDRRGNLAPPKGASPAVVALFEEISRRKMTVCEAEAAAGFSRSTITLWRHSVPRHNNLVAALNAVGLDLAVVPLAKGDA